MKFLGVFLGVLFQVANSSCHILSDESAVHASASSKVSTSQAIRFHLAPMQCYTNLAFRRLFQAISPDTTLWTEMEKVPDIIHADAAALARRFGMPGHKPLVLQLGGNDPMSIRQCIRHLSHHGYEFDEINLNCGCPSIESGGAATYGASLMKQPKLTHDLIAAIAEATSSTATVVSLKCRTAVYDTPEELQHRGRLEEDYRRLHDYIQHAYDGGISHLVLHARPAVLSGLSPTKNRHVPPIDYDTAQRISQDFAIDVTLNGNITGLQQLQQMVLEKRSLSFMAGRWMLRRPLDLSLIQSNVLSSPNLGVTESLAERALKAVEGYSDFVVQCIRSSRQDTLPSINDLSLPLFMITEQLSEDYEYAENPSNNVWMEYETMEDIYDCITDTVQQVQAFRRVQPTSFSHSAIEFNKLHSAFKSLIGKKVVSKWKRNRSEL